MVLCQPSELASSGTQELQETNSAAGQYFVWPGEGGEKGKGNQVFMTVQFFRSLMRLRQLVLSITTAIVSLGQCRVYWECHK